MNYEATDSHKAPALNVIVAASKQLPAPGKARVAWRIENMDSSQVRIEETWLPHGQFRAERQLYVPPLALPGLSSLILEREVNFAAVTAGAIENAFLILRVHYREAEWRIFVRVRAEVALSDEINPIVESITASPVSPSPEV